MILFYTKGILMSVAQEVVEHSFRQHTYLFLTKTHKEGDIYWNKISIIEFHRIKLESHGMLCAAEQWAYTCVVYTSNSIVGPKDYCQNRNTSFLVR